MRALGLDTSTLTGSVGVADQSGLLVQLSVATRDTHSVRLLAAVSAVLDAAGLAPADLDLIGVASGPGSFTGLRIGMATAKGLALALGRPILGISTLEATALTVHRVSGAPLVCVVMEAGRGEVYRGIYSFAEGEHRALDAESAMSPVQAVTGLPDGCLLAGDATPRCKSLIPSPAGRLTLWMETLPIAATIARRALNILERHEADRRAGRGLPALQPNYLRPADAELTPVRAR